MTLSFVLLTWLTGCGRLLDRADDALGVDLDIDIEQAHVDRMCRAAKRVDADTRGDVAKQLEQLATALAQDQLGRAGVALIEALKKVPPPARRKIVNEVLQHNGLEPLDCPPLERILFR